MYNYTSVVLPIYCTVIALELHMLFIWLLSKHERKDMLGLCLYSGVARGEYVSEMLLNVCVLKVYYYGIYITVYCISVYQRIDAKT